MKTGVAGGRRQWHTLHRAREQGQDGVSDRSLISTVPVVSSLTGTAIALGDTIAGDIATAGEVDSYVVSVPAGASISFDALSSDNVNGLNWSIQNQYGRIVLSNTVSIQDQGPVALAGGDYQIDLFGEGGTQTGAYSFRIVDASPEASMILIGDSIPGEIDVPGDSDLYSFSATAEQVIFLDLTAVSNANGLDWTLEDAFGRAILPRTTSLSDQGPFPLMGGNYTLKVLGELSTTGPGQTGTYQFRIVSVVDGTSAIAIGDTVAGAIDSPGQKDTFTFSAMADQRILLDQIATSNNNGLNWILDDAYGRRLVNQTASLADVGPVALMGGSYALTIVGEGDSTGTYQFALAGVTDTLTVIAIGDMVTDAVDPGQVDRYTFTAAVGQKIVLDQTATSNLNLLNWSLEDAAGRTVLGRTGDLNDRGPFTLMGGTYTLSVLGEQAGSSGTYEFQILDVTDDTAGMNVGDAVGGSIDPGSTDTWTFTAAPGQVVTLDLTATSNSAGLNWSLEDAYGRSVLARTASLADQGPFTLMGGSYTVRVLGEGATANGTYDFVLADDGIDGSFTPTGTVILPGDVVSSQIAAPGAQDDYRFTVAAGETIFLNLQAGATSLRWTLFDPVGEPLFALSQANNVTSQNQGPFILAGGEYTLRLEDAGTATPSYAFHLVDVQDGAGAFSLGDTVATTFTTPGAVQTYDVTLGSEAEVHFHLDASSSNVFWSLADPVGQTIFENARANAEQGPFTLLPGTYGLALDPENDTVPSITFTLAAVVHSSGAFAVDDVVSGMIPSYAGTSEHLVTLAAETRLYADLQVGAAGLLWSMVDPEGEAVFANVAANGTISGDRGPYPLAAGEYRIVFAPGGSGLGSYQFRLWSVQDQQQAASLDVQVASAFTDPGQTLTYEIPIAVDGDAFYFDNQLGTANMSGTLVDPAGQVVAGPFGISGTVSSDRGPFVLAAGTYALQLTASGGGALPAFQFTPWDSPQSSVALVVGAATIDDIAAPGSTHAYTFTATEGQKLLFDLTADTAGMTWTLIDSVGVTAGLFDAGTANSAAGDDVGPLRLEAGACTLLLDADGEGTPHYEFIVHDLAFDLTPLDVTASPEILEDGGVGRSVTANWTVLNDGGKEVAGTWVDRIVLSVDDIPGNGDDILLGEFAQSGPLASRATYSRMETVLIPDSLGLGSYLLFVVTDVYDDVAENLAEGNNVAERPLAVTPSGDQGAGLITVESFSPVGFSSSGSLFEIDFPLTGVVSLDHVRFVAADAFHWNAGNVLGSGNLELVLMNGRTEVLSVGNIGAAGNLYFRIDPVVRFNRDVTPAEIAALPSPMVDRVRFRVTSSGSTFTSTLESLHADGKLRLHLVQCEFAPCGPHRKQEFSALDSVGWDNSVPSPTPFLEYDLAEPVPMHGLRYLYGGPWLWTWGSGAPQASVELQIRLNDGSTLILDDWESPSTATTPTSNRFVTGHSLLLDDVVQAGVDGLWAVGFRWRVHATGAGFSVYPGCPASVSSVCGSGAPLKLFFVYEFGECAGQPAVAPIDIDPGDGSAFTSGSRVVLSGSVIAPANLAPVAGVLVNGAPVDSFDAAGRFFKAEQLADGDNPFQIQVVQPSCGESAVDLHLYGVDTIEAAFLNRADVSNQISASYSNTTFLRGPEYTLFDVTACNSGSAAVLGPLEMIITGTTEPSVTPARPEGLTGDGKPFVVVDDFGGPDRLMPGECAAPKPLAFYNPQRRPVRFNARWLSRANSPPLFETGPPTRATVDQNYVYDADAVDANGDSLSYVLEEAPPSMTIDPLTGVLSWAPNMAEVGTHAVAIEVADGLGGTARQEWTLRVDDGSANAAPFFTSAPPARASTGATLTYQAIAFDADGDPLTFSLLSGPPGSTIDPSTGLLTWPFTLPGNHAVDLSVDDGRGGTARQAWTLTVGSIPANPTVPTLFGSPASTATIGQVYLYQPVAGNLDAGETVTFVLDAAPAGMSLDPATGRVTWTPGIAQLGPNAVTLSIDDGNGGSASQAWSIDVSDTTANRSPVVVSVPDLNAVVGVPWTYPSHAVDPEGDTVLYALVSPPAGMVIDPAVGLATWTPAAVGSYSVALQATDPMGAFGAQVFTLEVAAVNDPPVINSIPPAGAGSVGGVYQYDVEAIDPEGQELIFGLLLSPAGMTVHPQSGLISWQPNQAQAGSHAVTVEAGDGHGGSAEQSFTVVIDPDLVAPQVHLALSSAQIAIDTQAKACVEAIDDIGITRRALLVDGLEVTLDPIGCAILTQAAPAMLLLRAEGYDAGGNLGFEEATLNIVDPSNGTAPTVTLISPTQESVLTVPTDIVATITDDDPNFLTWEVKVAPEATGVFTTIGSGSGEITSGVVATLDTTMLRNGTYRVEILGSDGVQSKGVEFKYHVSGELKLGDFELTFMDLVVPLAGIPIVITRTYSSLDTSENGFGAGWSLGLPGDLVDSAQEIAGNGDLADLLNDEPFTRTTRIYVTRPDGKRVGFTFDPSPSGTVCTLTCSNIPFISTAKFTPDPGVTDTLEAVTSSGSNTVWDYDGRFYDFIIPYNPDLYKLTTKEGVRYVIHESKGLQRIEDAGGHFIDVDVNGLHSSTGVDLTFMRDASNRIIKIIEPMDPNDPNPPPELSYVYDSTGNLVQFIDQVNLVRTYEYTNPQFPHYLTAMEDPSGQTVARSVYDSDGRLIALCDAGGNPVIFEGCTQFSADATARFETSINARGYRSDLFLDDRGNVLTERHWKDLGQTTYEETVRVYNSDNKLLSETDPSQETWTHTYESRQNETSRTDPLGRTWTMTYGNCNRVIEECDPDGNCSQIEYDSNCKTRKSVDTLGNVTEQVRAASGRLLETITPQGASWQYQYDPNPVPYAFRGTIDPRGNADHVALDTSGYLSSYIDRRGRQTDFEFDAAHRLVKETWQTPTPQITNFVYNAAGKLASIQAPDSIVNFVYSNSGRIVEENNFGTPGAPQVAITYVYDNNGNVESLSDSLGGSISYQRDHLDRVISVSDGTVLVDFSYSASGALDAITRYADTGRSTAVARTDFTHECGNCQSLPTSVTHRQGAGGPITHEILLDLDDRGRVVQMSDDEGQHLYERDGAGRILSADHPGGVQPDEFYSYDNDGNQVSSHKSMNHVYGYDLSTGGSELLQDDGYDYGYKENGALSLKTDRSTGEYWTFEYDYRDRLTRVEHRDLNGILLGSVDYGYDGLDRRISADDGSTKIHYFYHGSNAFLLVSSSGTVLSRRLYGEKIDDLLSEERAGVRAWFLSDHLGTVRDVLDGNGQDVNHNVYDSFGQILDSTNAAAGNDVGFQGREYDLISRMSYFRARDYDPGAGRFTSYDPVAPFGFDFAGNDPVSLSDPEGRQLAVYAKQLSCGAALAGAIATSTGLVLEWAGKSGKKAIETSTATSEYSAETFLRWWEALDALEKWAAEGKENAEVIAIVGGLHCRNLN